MKTEDRRQKSAVRSQAAGLIEHETCDPLSVIARPGEFEYTGIRLAGQSRGKPSYLFWIPAYPGMTNKAGPRFIRAASGQRGEDRRLSSEVRRKKTEDKRVNDHGTHSPDFVGKPRSALGSMVCTGLLLCAFALLTCGCASSTDPREGGFFGGVQGLQSGTYEERVQSRADSLNRLRDLQQDLDVQQANLESQKAGLEEEVALERQSLAALEQEVDGLEQDLSTYQADDVQKKQQIQELQARLTELKSQMQAQTSALDALEGSGAGDTDQDLRRRQLEEQRQALQEEFELLMDLSLELSK